MAGLSAWGQFYDPRTHAPVGPNIPCDQIYTMAVPPSGANSAAPIAPPKMLSNGQGRTTCSYYFPSGDRILYSSTFAANPACPPPADYSQGYVWPIYNTYTIYTAKPDGSDIRKHRRSGATPNRPSRATANISFSRPHATAISTSTRWTRMAQT